MDDLAPELHELAHGFSFAVAMMSDAQLGAFTDYIRTKGRPDIVTVLDHFVRVRKSGEADKLVRMGIEEVEAEQ